MAVKRWVTYWRMKFSDQQTFMIKNKKITKIQLGFWLFFAFMAVYYGWRMFQITPWYDELYTYYCFISKGPVYAAIHWPLPNNHVGYSVLSGFLDLLGNSYIGLRGVSYLCALANLYFLFKIGRENVREEIALCGVLLYAAMELVNQMAIQGRGYTLGVTCMLAAFLCLQKICTEKQPSRWTFILYAGALVLGLYDVSSNVYWVIPLCLGGGVYLLPFLLGRKQEETGFRRRLLQLVIASLAAALLTILLYGVIWLAIGSNLLVKDETGIYYGMSHVKMIFSAPFAALQRGMQYMLDTPYIQSETGEGFLARLLEFFVVLAGSYLPSLKWPALILFVGGGAGLIALYIKKRSPLTIFLIFQIFFVPVCLLIQCKRPYYRVFTYGGAVLSLLFMVLAGYVLEKLKKESQIGRCSLLLLAVLTVFSLYTLLGTAKDQFGERENEIRQVLSHATISEDGNYCVTDCNQQYLLFFLYGIRCEDTQIEGKDMVILDERMTDPKFQERVWEFYQYYDTIPWEYINKQMTESYRSSHYILYERKDRKG